MLDAFDFLLLTFVVTRIATTFDRTVADVAFSITLTLMCRPIGALIFGWFADRFGRRTPLMIDIAFYSLIELLTAFSPNFTMFLVLRALYGIAMGGEWGLGAAMTMEALPPNRRGFYSGLLQSGYMAGYLLATAVYYGVFTFTQWDWRALFVIGVLPAGLILYIRTSVPESPVWLAGRAERIAAPAGTVVKSLLQHWPLFLYAVAFMATLNAMSHGTQDLYATFLQKQHGFSTSTTSLLSSLAAVGAIAGSITFGTLSQRVGRRASVMICALFGACTIPLWALSPTVGLLGDGRLRHAVHDPGRLGRDTRASQRALARRRPRHVSGLHLSDRQSRRRRHGAVRGGARAAHAPSRRTPQLRCGHGNCRCGRFCFRLRA